MNHLGRFSSSLTIFISSANNVFIRRHQSYATNLHRGCLFTSNISTHSTLFEARINNVCVPFSTKTDNSNSTIRDDELLLERKLTQKETKLFEFLRNVVTYHSNLSKSSLRKPLTLRVAGGWVRDKVLGISSSDIDIVLDTMSAVHFTKLVKQYQRQKGLDVSGSGVIRLNPDQSKHLETTTMKLFDHSIDFNQLRCEDYTERDSRIPSIKSGTPTDDAERRTFSSFFFYYFFFFIVNFVPNKKKSQKKIFLYYTCDFTINSLFYNLNTKSIEDFTGKGIVDLKRGVLSTPLKSLKTFQDDPLRVLRGLRFACTYVRVYH